MGQNPQKKEKILLLEFILFDSTDLTKSLLSTVDVQKIQR